MFLKTILLLCCLVVRVQAHVEGSPETGDNVALKRSLQDTNVALNKPATQSSEWFGNCGAELAVDGNTNGVWSPPGASLPGDDNNSIQHTSDSDNNPEWEVDLLGKFKLTSVTIFNRIDRPWSNRLSGAIVAIKDETKKLLYTSDPLSATDIQTVEVPDDVPSEVRYVTVSKATRYLHVAEVQVFGSSATTPTPVPPSFVCFSGANTVEVQGKGTVFMKDLMIGDRVMTSKGFSRVFSFGHLDHKAIVRFLQIQTKQTILEVTDDHMVFANGSMVRAGDISVNDTLGSSMVVSIGIVERKGFYAPTTESGELLVSGIHVSCFAALIGLGPPWFEHLVNQAVHGPHRWLCALNFFACEKEEYSDDGFSKFGLHVLAPTVLRFAEFPSSWIKTALIAPLLPAVVFVSVIDFLVFESACKVWMVVGGLLLFLASPYAYKFTEADKKKIS